MIKAGIDQDAIVKMFAEATANPQEPASDRFRGQSPWGEW